MQDNNLVEGLKIISDKEKNSGFLDVFAVWSGYGITMAIFLFGSLGIGAGIVPAIVSSAIGILFISLITLISSKIGFEQGITGTTAMRSAFGINGRYIPAIIMSLIVVGFFGLQTAIVGKAVYSIVKDIAPPITFSPSIWMLISGLLMGLLAVFGYRFLVWLNRIAVPALVILFVFLAYKIITEFGESLSAFQPANDMSVFNVINIMPAGMATVVIVSIDFGRFAKNKKSLLGAPVSIFIFFNLIGILGLLSAAIAGTWDPVDILLNLGFGAIALILLILAQWSTNIANLFLGSLSMSNVFGLSRKTNTIILTIIGTIISVSGIYSYEGIEVFLSLISSFLIPAAGILLADYFIVNKQKISIHDLFKKEDSIYWYYKGWNLRALLAWIIGIISSLIMPAYLVPAITSVFITGIIYLLILKVTNYEAKKIDVKVEN